MTDHSPIDVAELRILANNLYSSLFDRLDTMMYEAHKIGEQCATSRPLHVTDQRYSDRSSFFMLHSPSCGEQHHKRTVHVTYLADEEPGAGAPTLLIRFQDIRIRERWRCHATEVALGVIWKCFNDDTEWDDDSTQLADRIYQRLISPCPQDRCSAR